MPLLYDARRGYHPEYAGYVFGTKIKQADVVLLSSEPSPFKHRHLAELQGAAPSVRLIDGEACSWHGTAMLRGFRELARWAADSAVEAARVEG